MFKHWAQYIFFHLHFSVVNHWEKLKCIERTLQLTNFWMFIIIKNEYIDVESKYNFIRIWEYWHTKWNGFLGKKIMKKRIGIEQSICHLDLHYFFVGIIKQLLHLPTRSTILGLWNMKFNYYKEQSLELAMVKHKLESGTSFGAKCMKWFETKDTIMEIKLALLDQIHFPTCMHITMWAIMKEDHNWMVRAKLNEFRKLPMIKETICSF